MHRHFDEHLDALKSKLTLMGSLAEEAIHKAIESRKKHDSAIARRVIDGDGRINTLEIEIDQAIVDLLALQQPVAIDLRFILAAQKINNDLERIGDHAVNIAESALALAASPFQGQFLHLPEMADLAQKMFHDALDGFIHGDPALGRAVLELDDRIDDLNRQMTTEVIRLMRDKPETVEAGLDLIRVSRNLERVADLATNIAEEIIFITQARVVKHHAEDHPDTAD